MEFLSVCMLSVFAPAHFWPSLKHLFSRCCSWQALHDIKSEILTENQTASRPLAAPIHRLFFAVQICVFPFFLSWTSNSLWHGTNYFIIIRPVFCLLFSGLDPEVMAAVSELHDDWSLYITVPAALAVSYAAAACPPSRGVIWMLTRLFLCDINRCWSWNRKSFLVQIWSLHSGFCFLFSSSREQTCGERYFRFCVHSGKKSRCKCSATTIKPMFDK